MAWTAKIGGFRQNQENLYVNVVFQNGEEIFNRDYNMTGSDLDSLKTLIGSTLQRLQKNEVLLDSLRVEIPRAETIEYIAPVAPDNVIE